MKSDAALSWKGLALSAVLHGSVVAAAGLVLFKPAQVGTREAPVSAELEFFHETPASSASAVETSEIEPLAASGTHDGMPEEARKIEKTGNRIVQDDPGETVLPIPVLTEQTPENPFLSGHSKGVNSSIALRNTHRSTVRPVDIAQPGAKNILPEYLNNPPPQYPEHSRLAGEQGVVLVRAGVAATGKVIRVELARSSGYPGLDHAAVEAVRGWKFHPASAAGISMDSEVTVPVRFELHESKEDSIRNP